VLVSVVLAALVREVLVVLRMLKLKLVLWS
jgi:hypothetical protein